MLRIETPPPLGKKARSAPEMISEENVKILTEKHSGRRYCIYAGIYIQVVKNYIKRKL